MSSPSDTAVDRSVQNCEDKKALITPAEPREEMRSRHKKDLKAFEGEKRAALKNAKSKGKRGKSAIKDAEFKYSALERDLKERHNIESGSLAGGGVAAVESVVEEILGANVAVDDGATATDQNPAPPSKEAEVKKSLEAQESKRKKALEKKLRKRANVRQKETDRETEIEKENEEAGPSQRQIEVNAINAIYLDPRNLQIGEVQADGNCLYRAVATQCRRLRLSLDNSLSGTIVGEGDYSKIRSLCAGVMLGPNREEYEPFAEFGPSEGNDSGDYPTTYDQYVEMVRSSSTWGGQLEIRALSEGLKCPITIYFSEGPPLTMGSEFGNSDEGSGELMLSFHRHYYALGEHYNSVVPKVE